MVRNIEFEFKNMLNKQEFHSLLHTFHISEHDFFKQTNYYFDTETSSLALKEVALRIRKSADRYKLTLKKKLENGLLEINEEIDFNTAQNFIENNQIPLGDITDEIISMGIDPVTIIYQGELTTYRATVHYRNGVLMFDHSFYLDSEDYEVEYEVSEEHLEEGQKDFISLLNQLKITLRDADSKIKRFHLAKNEKQHRRQS